jgi:hypothetical protein
MGKAKAVKSKNEQPKKSRSKWRKGAKTKGMAPRLLRAAIEQLCQAGVLQVHKERRECFYQIPKELARAVGEAAPSNFDPLRQKTLISG